MKLAYPKQKFQDWVTQQWVILWGKQIDPKTVPWLMGPFGKVESTSDLFINQLAERENLVIERNSKSKGLLSSIDKLKLSENELSRLPKEIIEFYERTSNYNLAFSVKWNPLFKLPGILVNILFSSRIEQLNIPSKSTKYSNEIESEIITLSDPNSNSVKYTFWHRAAKSSGQVIYSGIYTSCTLPSGITCIKAIFPLPNGNATVIMTPTVTADGKLHLISAGKKFGDPGFYFLLKDSEGSFWAKYIPSFRDELLVSSRNGKLEAEQNLTLWNKPVVRFKYEISSKIKHE